METQLSDERLLSIYRKMLLIRRSEEKLEELSGKGLIPGFLHLSIGNEAAAVGVCDNLRIDDMILTTHRGHGHYIAKGGDLKKLFAELMGKKTGCCHGMGGSMHVGDLSVGAFFGNAIVGQNMPIANGVAFALKREGGDRVVACFFGDGASNTGAFHEALNLASLWKLPVIFVCENNQYAISTHVSRSTSVRDISARAAAYGMEGISVDGMNVIEVHAAAKKAVDRARKEKLPTLLECKTYKIYKAFEDRRPPPYRSEEEIRRWMERDPIKLLRERLLREGVLTEDEDRRIKNEVEKEIDEAVEFGIKSEFPDPNEAIALLR
ncbi:MAG: hypothetical protein APU95_06345 [Hadesarchaea archaeon YNP_N21]|nr:MAG: hypothetical protein APU95_06345 [Hadesarchaea archaeon YNP_N21]